MHTVIPRKREFDNRRLYLRDTVSSKMAKKKWLPKQKLALAIQDRCTVSIKDEKEVVCTLSNGNIADGPE